VAVAPSVRPSEPGKIAGAKRCRRRVTLAELPELVVGEWRPCYATHTAQPFTSRLGQADFRCWKRGVATHTYGQVDNV